MNEEQRKQEIPKQQMKKYIIKKEKHKTMKTERQTFIQKEESKT